MADSFVDYIRRKYKGMGMNERQLKAVEDWAAGPMSGMEYGSSGNQGYGGNTGGWGSAAAAQAARIGSNAGYTGGGPTSGPATGSTPGGTVSSSSGGSTRSGIGSDFVSGGGPYAGGMYSGGVYSQPRSVPTTTFQAVPDTAPRTSSGFGDYGGGNFVRNETRILGPGMDRRGYGSSGLGDVGGKAVPIQTLGDYTGSTTGTHGARPASLGGRYVPSARNSPYAGNTSATGKGAYGSAVHDQFFDSIMKAEGTTTHGYNTTYGNKYMDLENMTINDVLGVQKGMISKSGHSPMGAFQITRDTLIDHGKRVGLDFAVDKFNAENQRKVALSIAATNPSLSKWDGFRKHPDQLTRAKKAYGAIGKLPAVAPGTVAMYRGRQPAAGGIGSDYGASASRGMGSSPGSSYGSGGYKGGSYGGAGGGSINQGVGGAFKNR